MVGEVLSRPDAGVALVDGVELQDKCGVAGMFFPAQGNVVAPTAAATRAQEHRGQGATGLATMDADGHVEVFRDSSRARDAFGKDNENLSHLPLWALVAISHNRYPTNRVDVDPRLGIQPFVKGEAAQSHNGEVTNANAVGERFGVDVTTCASDSEIVFQAACNAARKHDGDMVKGYQEVLPYLEGAFSIVAMTRDSLIGMRDRHGVRPLVVGTFENGGTMIASEITGLKAAGATFKREILPGEMVIIDKDGERSEMWADPDVATCLFEYVYLSKGTNIINGRYVNDVRADMGRRLAGHAPVEADVVIDVPASGEQYALAYAEASGIPYGFGLRKNPNYGRGFIESSTEKRQEAAMGKQEVLPDTVRGKRVVVIDDSIVRGDSLPIVVQKLRVAGATEVHIRIPADMYSKICNLGVATADRDELLAVRMNGDLEKMCVALGVDSIAFLPRSEMIEAVGSKELCSGCMGGEYAGASREPVFTAESLFAKVRATGRVAVTS